MRLCLTLLVLASCRSGPIPGAVDASPDATSGQDAAADARPLACQAGCPQLDGTKFCVCTGPFQFAEARNACETAGLQMARVDDQGQANAIETEAGNLGESIWLGGTDLAVEGTWRWTDNDDMFWVGTADGSAPAGVFTNFGNDEPNDSGGEDCLLTEVGGWNDADCGLVRIYACMLP